MKTKSIRVIQGTVNWNKQAYGPGEVIDMPEDEAARLIRLKVALPAVIEPPPGKSKAKKTEEPENG